MLICTMKDRGGINMKTSDRILFLLATIVIGLLIALSPNIITGSTYDINHIMGGLLIAEFIVRTMALVIGLITIYTGFKYFFNAK